MLILNDLELFSRVQGVNIAKDAAEQNKRAAE